MSNTKIKDSQGYTLIEVLISVAIFFIVVAGPTGLFVSSLKNQSRLLGVREIVDNSSYVFDYMSRALRMAQKELDCTDKLDEETCSCLTSSGYGYNYEITRSGKGIKFNTSQDPAICQEFFWDDTDDRLKEIQDGGQAIALTSDDLEVVSFIIKEFGLGQDDNVQPKITMFLKIRKKGESNTPQVSIQTTISQRNLDVAY